MVKFSQVSTFTYSSPYQNSRSVNIWGGSLFVFPLVSSHDFSFSLRLRSSAFGNLILMRLFHDICRFFFPGLIIFVLFAFLLFTYVYHFSFLFYSCFSRSSISFWFTHHFFFPHGLLFSFTHFFFSFSWSFLFLHDYSHFTDMILYFHLWLGHFTYCRVAVEIYQYYHTQHVYCFSF